MNLNYPKKFTDSDWKKAEKKIKVKATGIGKTLRNLEKAMKAIDTELNGDQDPDALHKVKKKAVSAAQSAYDAMHKTWIDQKKGSDAYEHLADLRHAMGRFQSELESFEPVDHRGIQWPVDRFNSRVNV